MNLRSYKVIHLIQFLVRLRPSQSDSYPGYQYFLPLQPLTTFFKSQVEVQLYLGKNSVHEETLQ